MSGLAIICGAGDLPRLLAENCAKFDRDYHVVTLENVPLSWISGHPVIPARIEKISKLCADLHKQGCDEVVFAGSLSRPNVDKSELDLLGAQLATEVLGATKKGDDQTLRFVIALFEGQGFTVVGAAEVFPDLVPEVGILSGRSPSELELRDAKLAQNFVMALGKLDVGQGAVVAGGLCLGLETIQGTDKMLEFVGTTRPNSGGILFKAPKPGQDLRIDMPVIGVETVRNAIKAGLGGIAFQGDSILVINMRKALNEADAANLAIWAFE